MKHTKISITLEPDVAAELRRVARPGRLSASVNEADSQQLQAGRVREQLQRMDEDAGPVPDEVQRRVAALDWPD